MVIAGVLLVACNDSETKSSTATSSTNQNLLDMNRQVFRAIETGDSATLAKYIGDDAIDHGGAPDGGDLKGKQIVAMLAGIHNDIDNMKFEILEDAANDDHVFTLARLTGTTNKPVWGMPANHKMDSKGVDVVRVKDGKIVEHWGFLDQQEVMKMMQAGGGHSNATDTSGRSE